VHDFRWFQLICLRQSLSACAGMKRQIAPPESCESCDRSIAAAASIHKMTHLIHFLEYA